MDGLELPSTNFSSALVSATRREPIYRVASFLPLDPPQKQVHSRRSKLLVGRTELLLRDLTRVFGGLVLGDEVPDVLFGVS